MEIVVRASVIFFFLFLLFVRFFPVIAMAEVKAVLPQANPHWSGYEHAEHAVPPPLPAAASASTGGH